MFSKPCSVLRIILNASVEAIVFNKMYPFRGIAKFIMTFHPRPWSQLKDPKRKTTITRGFVVKVLPKVVREDTQNVASLSYWRVTPFVTPWQEATRAGSPLLQSSLQAVALAVGKPEVTLHQTPPPVTIPDGPTLLPAVIFGIAPSAPPGTQLPSKTTGWCLPRTSTHL